MGFQWDISHRITEYQNWLGPKRSSSPVLLNYFKPAELWIFSPKRHLVPKPHVWKTMVLLLLKAGWSAGPIPQWPVVPKQQHPKAPLGQLLPALTKEQETWTQERPLTVRVTLQVWFTDSLSIISCQHTFWQRLVLFLKFFLFVFCIGVFFFACFLDLCLFKCLSYFGNWFLLF